MALVQEVDQVDQPVLEPDEPSEVTARRFLPDGRELAEHLGKRFRYPAADPHDLVRVAEYAVLDRGDAPLYDELHQVFDVDYPPTPLHDFLARLPGALRDRGYRPQGQLIVSTNYDDVLERAFRAAGEPFDRVVYMAVGNSERGKFIHEDPSGTAELIERPNEYQGLPVDDQGLLVRPVILKIHGAVDRTPSALEPKDSYVITEDHYIDYLTHTDISFFVPAQLVSRLRRSHFLFLGYSLKDWNLRVILHRIWGDQPLRYKSWAIQIQPHDLDRKFWQQRNVEILNVPLDDYVAELSEHLEVLVPATESA